MESRIMPPVGMGAEAHRKGPSALPSTAERKLRLCLTRRYEDAPNEGHLR